MDIKYNPFIVCVLTNNKEYLFNSEGTLLYPVPFGNYKIGDHISEENWDLFQKCYDKYIKEHNIKFLSTELIAFDFDIGLYNCVFTYNENYYKVPLEKYEYYGWDTDPVWLEDNLEDYQVYKKSVTKIVYE